MENYFSKFPTFVYANTLCVDITRRSVVANTVQVDLFAYHPYTLKSVQRPDTIANRYYNDPSYDWLVYFSNRVTDPYYAFPMDSDTFTNFINVKYGSYVNAVSTIVYWQMNWAGDTDDTVPVSVYDSTIPEPLKKYYEAVYGQETRILYYKRRRADWFATTNMIVYFQTSNISGTFLPNEPLNLIIPAGNSVISNSYVTFANTTQVTVQHVLGNVSSNDVTQYVMGQISGATANVLQIVEVANNISEGEAVFWSPVYAYDYENNLNEQKKFIQLIDSKYAMTIAETLRTELKE